MYHSLFIHSPIEGYLGCFQVLAIMNKATVNIYIYIFVMGTSLMVQWVRLHAPNAGGPGSIPGRGTRSHMHAATKSSHATTKTWHSQNK